MGSTRSIIDSRSHSTSEAGLPVVSSATPTDSTTIVRREISSDLREAARSAALELNLGDASREALPVISRAPVLGLDIAGIAAARAAFQAIQLMPNPESAGSVTISAPELSVTALSELFQHYQTLYGLNDSEAILRNVPPSQYLQILRSFADAIRAGIEAAPDVRYRLETRRLLAAIYAELAARGGGFQDSHVLGEIAQAWLVELREYPISNEVRSEDLRVLLGFARDQVLLGAGREALVAEVQRQIDEALAPGSEDEELRVAIARHQHADVLVRAASEALGGILLDRCCETQNALVVDALRLEQEAEFCEGAARVAVLGELAALYERLAEDPVAASFYHSRLLATLHDILAVELPDVSARVSVRLEIAGRMEALGYASRAAEIREALAGDARAALLRASSHGEHVSETMQELTEALLIYQALDQGREVEVVSLRIRELLTRVMQAADLVTDPELQDQYRAFALEGFMLLGDVEAAETLLNQIVAAIPDSISSESVESHSQWLLRLMSDAQEIATLRSELSDTETDFSQFRNLLGQLERLGVDHELRTMQLYAQFMAALLDQDPSAESLYQELQDWRPEGFRELEEVNAAAPGFLRLDSIPEHVPDLFQQMSARIWETQRLPFIAQRTAPTIQLLSEIIESAYGQQIAELEDEGSSSGTYRDLREDMRRYLSHVQAILSSGRANTTREAIALLNESTGDSNASERFMIELGMAFDSDFSEGYCGIVNQILDFEEMGASQLRAERMLGLARTLIVSDSLDQRFGGLIDALLTGAEGDLDATQEFSEMESVLRLRFPEAEAHELWDLYDQIVGNDTLSERVDSARNISPYIQGFNQIVDQVFSVEGGVIMLASIFTGGIAAELAGAAALARMGATAYTVVNGAARLTWAARATLWGGRVGAGFAARSAVELGATAAWRLAVGRRQMNLEEVRQRLIVSLFSSIGDEFATHLTQLVVPGLLRPLIGAGARARMFTHVTTGIAEFFTTGLGEMWGEQIGGSLAGGPLDNRPFWVQYFQECVHGAFFMAGHRVGRPVTEALYREFHTSDRREPSPVQPRERPPQRWPSFPSLRLGRVDETTLFADLDPDFIPILISQRRGVARSSESTLITPSPASLRPAGETEEVYRFSGGAPRGVYGRSLNANLEQNFSESVRALLEEVRNYHDTVSSMDAFAITREPYVQLVRRATALLRGSEGSRLLNLAEIDALENAFGAPRHRALEIPRDRSVVYGFDPRSGAGVFQAISQEHVQALARYIRALGARRVVEVGAGDGRFAAALRAELGASISVRATDNRSWDISGESVEVVDALEAAREADVIMASWVPNSPESGQPFDFHIARMVQANPEKTFILLMASGQTGSRAFHREVLGDSPLDVEAVDVETLETWDPRRMRSVPVRVEEPLSLNAVYGPDRLLYRLGRSRCKISGVREGSYTLVLRSSEATPGPVLRPLTLSDYLPDEHDQVSEIVRHHEVVEANISNEEGEPGSGADEAFRFQQGDENPSEISLEPEDGPMPSHPFIPFLARWPQVAWNYSGQNRIFLEASAEWAQRFNAEEVSVDELVLGMRDLIHEHAGDAGIPLLMELACSLADAGLVEPVHRLLVEEDIFEIRRLEHPTEPELWETEEGKIRVALIRALVRQGIFEGEFDPVAQLNQIYDREIWLRGCGELFAGLVARGQSSRARELAFQFCKDPHFALDVETRGRLWDLLDRVMIEAVHQPSHALFWGNVVAAGVGVATLLSEGVAHASVGIAQAASSEMPNWILGIGLTFGLGVVFSSRKSTPVSGQLNLGEDPRLAMRQSFIRRLRDEGMDRIQVRLLEALHAGRYLSLPEIAALTHHSIPSGQALPRIMELEAAGLVRGSGPSFGITPEGRRVFALFRQFDFGLFLSASNRRLIRSLESGRWFKESSQALVAEAGELASLYERGVLERRLDSNRYKGFLYRLSPMGQEILQRDLVRRHVLEKLAAEMT